MGKPLFLLIVLGIHLVQGCMIPMSMIFSPWQYLANNYKMSVVLASKLGYPHPHPVSSWVYDPLSIRCIGIAVSVFAFTMPLLAIIGSYSTTRTILLFEVQWMLGCGLLYFKAWYTDGEPMWTLLLSTFCFFHLTVYLYYYLHGVAPTEKKKQH